MAVAGLGAIGFRVARAVDEKMPGLALVAVSARRPEQARRRLAGFRSMPRLLPIEELAEEADVVVECLPPDLLKAVGEPAIHHGRVLVVASAGALLRYPELLEAGETGVQIIVPSGALVALDGLRAAAEAGLEQVRLVTRKPTKSFADRVSVAGEDIDLSSLREPRRLYSGTVRAAVAAFPVNVNVAAAVSFAGLGPDDTEIEVWADPSARSNCHSLLVASKAGRFTVEVENLPDPDNPKSSSLTAYSIIACLRRLEARFTVGS